MKVIARWARLIYLSIKFSIIFILRLVWLFPASYPKIMRQFFEQAGGALIKIGQILALRYELLPPQYCWELSELFDNVPPLTQSQVYETIYQELGKQPNEIFALFGEQPIASASFAQVHKAVLLDGRVVAVKIQRPGLEIAVKTDFRFLRFISAILSIFLHFKAIRIKEILEELEQTTQKELDFRMEKDNAEVIRQNIENNERFIVPKTYTEFTTNKVLIQDFVEGINLNDILRVQQRRSNKILPKLDVNLDTVALDIAAEIARQYIVCGIYHSDPHPGNIILTKDDKIAFVDFGIVGHSKPYDRALFWDFVHPVAVELNPVEAANALLRLGLRPIEDRVRFLAQDKDEAVKIFFEIVQELASTSEKSFGTIVTDWSHSIGNPAESLYNRSTAVALLKAMKLAEKYNVHFQKDLILFIRTLVIADMMAMQISPTFKISRALQQFASAHQEQLADLKKLVQTTPTISNEQLTDPWDQDTRDLTKEYIIDWFQDLIDNRPSLYKKIRPLVQRLEQSL